MPVPGAWDYCGLPVSSPLAVAAGPLLNGKWVRYYAALGFDVLTYKTVRSVATESYPMPNLQPVGAGGARWDAATSLPAEGEMRGAWAVSFGMPSRRPDVWRADVEATRKALPPGKVLSVSVVATPRPGWGPEELADDFATCARWAVDSGAHCVEANFSCPNVATSDGQLYLNAADAGRVAAHVRAAIPRTPLLVKIGHVVDETRAEQLVRTLAPHVDALAMVNCIPAKVTSAAGGLMFGGERRGVAGKAIRDAALDQVRLFARIVRQHPPGLRLIGVGGIGSAQDVGMFLASGCHAVQLATAAMLDPQIGCRIRQELAGNTAREPARGPI